MRKEATEGDILRNAAFASLDGRALTPEAKKLVAEINSRVVACVSLEESKPGRVKTNRKKLKAATEAFVADLLTAQSGKLPRRWVYRAMTARGFTGAVGYRVFKPLMEALRALGLIECQSAFKFDPVSASNFDPFERRVLTVALVSSELAGIAETRRARVV